MGQASAGRDNELSVSAQARLGRALAPATRTAYTRRWSYFETWCAEAGRSALPATRETVATYVDDLANRDLSPNTLLTYVRTIRRHHRATGHTPPDLLLAKDVIDGYTRELAESKTAWRRRAPAMTLDELRRIVTSLDLTSCAGLRDRAIFLLGYSLLARPSELTRLDLADVTARPDDLAVLMRASKNQPPGNDSVRCLHRTIDPVLCPVQAVQAWTRHLHDRGRHNGPLFVRVGRYDQLGAIANGGRYRNMKTRDDHLDPKSMTLIIQRASLAAEVSPAFPHRPDEQFSSRSLRRGGATSMLLAGALPHHVIHHGRWADNSTAFYRYIDDATATDTTSRNPTSHLW